MMSGISGISSAYSSVSSAALQSQISKLQGQYADCASCATTPEGEKQNQQSMIGEEIQSLKAELAKVSMDESQVRLYKPNLMNQAAVESVSNYRLGKLINLNV